MTDRNLKLLSEIRDDMKESIKSVKEDSRADFKDLKKDLSETRKVMFDYIASNDKVTAKLKTKVSNILLVLGLGGFLGGASGDQLVKILFKEKQVIVKTINKRGK